MTATTNPISYLPPVSHQVYWMILAGLLGGILILASCDGSSEEPSPEPEIHRGEDGTPTRLEGRKWERPPREQ